jgi:hypothetical protein
VRVLVALTGGLQACQREAAMYDSIDAIRRDNPVWFSPDTIRFFRSRIQPTVYPVPDGAVFVTSEAREAGTPRMFTVRFARDGGGIDTVGDFMGYTRARPAHVAARKAAEAAKIPKPSPK